jgi:hypothetical protein
MGMIDFRAIVGKRAIKDFEKTMKSQVPFATALALTTAAGWCRTEVVRKLPEEFIIRNNFTRRGIKTERANKSDWPKCYSVVGSVDEYMVDQAEGGTRTKTKRNKSFPIPYSIRSSIQDLIPKRQWPSKLLQTSIVKLPMGGRTKGATAGHRGKPRPFLAINKKGHTGLYVRSGRFYKTGNRKRERLTLLYRFNKTPIRIKRRDWLVKVCEQVIEGRMDDAFYKAMKRALV